MIAQRAVVGADDYGYIAACELGRAERCSRRVGRGWGVDVDRKGQEIRGLSTAEGYHLEVGRVQSLGEPVHRRQTHAPGNQPGLRLVLRNRKAVAQGSKNADAIVLGQGFHPSRASPHHAVDHVDVGAVTISLETGDANRSA